MVSISWEEEEPNNQPTQRNFDPVNTELVCRASTQTNNPGDVKVEMFGIETTEIISAHEHYKKPGEEGGVPHTASTQPQRVCRA